MISRRMWAAARARRSATARDVQPIMLLPRHAWIAVLKSCSPFSQAFHHPEDQERPIEGRPFNWGQADDSNPLARPADGRPEGRRQNADLSQANRAPLRIMQNAGKNPSPAFWHEHSPSANGNRIKKNRSLVPSLPANIVLQVLDESGDSPADVARNILLSCLPRVLVNAPFALPRLRSPIIGNVDQAIRRGKVPAKLVRSIKCLFAITTDARHQQSTRI